MANAPYQKIAAHYRALIQRGTLTAGDRLPTIREIAQEWSVARQTADKAVAALRRDGLVTTAGRGGTIVAAHDGATVVLGLDEPAGLTVTATELHRASPTVAKQLGVKPGSAVVVVRLEPEARS